VLFNHLTATTIIEKRVQITHYAAATCKSNLKSAFSLLALTPAELVGLFSNGIDIFYLLIQWDHAL
jgi:hypothetical protein